MKNQFEIPKRWYIKACEKLHEYSRNRTNVNGNMEDHYYWWDLKTVDEYDLEVWRFSINNPPSGCTEISFEQFEKYILNKENVSKELKVREERVLETIKKYPDSKGLLEELFPEIIVEEKFYKIGQRFKMERPGLDGYEVILAQVNPGIVNFIDLKDGNRHYNEVRVKNVINITQEELNQLLSQSRGRANWSLIT